MEVTALTSLLSSAEATADPGEQTAGGTGFGKILGKALGTKQNGKTEQKKTGQQEKTEDDDLPEQTAVQLAALLLPIAVGAQTAPAGTTAAGSQTGQESSAAALSPLQPAAQELFPTQGAAVAADQFVANVMQ